MDRVCEYDDLDIFLNYKCFSVSIQHECTLSFFFFIMSEKIVFFSCFLFNEAPSASLSSISCKHGNISTFFYRHSRFTSRSAFVVVVFFFSSVVSVGCFTVIGSFSFHYRCFKTNDGFVENFINSTFIKLAKSFLLFLFLSL